MSKSQQKRLDAQRDDAWYIRKAVELADGWSIDNYENDDADYDYLHNAGGMEWHLNQDPMWVHDIPEMFIDALAAQLVRQVDALDEPMGITVQVNYTTFMDGQNTKVVGGGDRTMNTLKAIVDVGVLQQPTEPKCT